jgi:hypothetical protein
LDLVKPIERPLLDAERILGRAAADLTERPDQMELIFSEGRSLREARFLIEQA